MTPPKDMTDDELNKMSCEPLITIWGKELSIGQSMTIRVAIESFASELMSNGIGDDEMGRKLDKAYLQRIKEIRDLIFYGTIKDS